MNTPVFRSILVATDLMEGSDAVIRAAASLAGLAEAELHVVHACDLPVLPYRERHYDVLAMQRCIHDTRRALDEQLRRVLAGPAQVASRQVLVSAPAAAILNRAAEVAADLVVLGPHRPRTFGTFGLGTTADRVIRAATAPCLIVRGELPLPLRRLLVPLDLSDPSRGALDLALTWAMNLDGSSPASLVPEAEVTVAHVVPSLYESERFPLERELLEPVLEREIQGAVVRTGAGGHLAVREEIVWGDLPAEEILHLAAEERADLVVMATHGHGAVMRALIGSVASRVAQRAACSVLLVPPSRWDADEPDVEAWAGLARAFTPATPLL